MKAIVRNAWFWFAVFCIGLFFIVQIVLGVLVGWAVRATL